MLFNNVIIIIIIIIINIIIINGAITKLRRADLESESLHIRYVSETFFVAVWRGAGYDLLWWRPRTLYDLKWQLFSYLIFLSRYETVPDPDFEMGGGWSSRPLDKGGAGHPPKLFWPFGPQFGVKIGGWPPRAPPWICYCDKATPF